MDTLQNRNWTQIDRTQTEDLCFTPKGPFSIVQRWSEMQSPLWKSPGRGGVDLGNFLKSKTQVFYRAIIEASIKFIEAITF